MAQNIKLKRSSVAGKVPTTAQLEAGEIAINTADGKLYFERDDSTIQTIVTTNALITGSIQTTGGFTGSLYGTASWAVNTLTASYTLQALSSSYALTASYVNPLTQEVQITGSLLISGSTVQVGNNTLLGNTILSGSIIISGSENPSTPTIQIFGDTQHTGVVRFNPIARNIDTSISASYIYVSGSTSDLYFSQNGDGYANTTRLRWLEGNLYTGLLNGGVITIQSPTTYQISSGSGIIVNLNASLNDNPYPVIQYLNWTNLSASIAAFTASYQQAFVGIDSTSNIFAQGTPFSNGQFDTIINVGNVLFQNQSTINGVKTQPSVAYGFEQQQNTFNRAFGPLKLSGYTLAPSGSSTGSLIVGSGTAYAPGSNYTIDPNEPYYTTDSGTNISKIFRYYQSGSSWVYLTNAAAGYTTIDPGQYSNNGVLSSVGNGEWTIQRVFWFPNSVTKAIVVYYGNVKYTTEADAIANISFESFVEAPNTAANAIYLGAIVIAGNGVFTNTTSYKIQPGGLFRQVGGSGGGGSLVTQTLSGLSDVNVSAPTNYQALVYNTNQQKWINASFVSASISGNANTSTTSITASYALTASYVNTLNQDVTITRDLVVGGRITAEEFHTEFISSSIIFQSGSTKFGNSSDDTHQFTGSVYTTGKVNIGTVDNFGSDPDKFLALTGAEVVYRTGAQLLSDIGGQTAGTFVQNSGLGGTARYIMRYEDSNSATTSSIYEDTSGNIGIKKTTPGAALDVNGSGIITGSLNVSGIGYLASVTSSQDIQVNGITVGRGTGNSNTNILLGSGSLGSLTTGTNNTVIGVSSNLSSTTSEQNTFVGNQVFITGSSANRSVGMGYQAMYNSSAASIYENVAIGYRSQYKGGGLGNVAVGAGAMTNGSGIGGVGTYNVAIGTYSMGDGPGRGDSNIGIGGDTLYSLTSGSNNIALGQGTLAGNTKQNFNIGLGYQAMYRTGQNDANGGNNIAIGRSAGTNMYSGSNNIFIGPSAGSSFNTVINNVVIGGFDGFGSPLASQSGNMILATGNGTIRMFVTGSNGNIALGGHTNPQFKVDITGSLAIRDTATVVQQGIQVSGTSTLTVASISTTSYDGAFLDYLIVSGSNRRAGTLATVWTASDIEWKDTSTLDLGSTNGAEFTPAINGSNADLVLAVPTGTWTVKGHLRYM